MSVHTKRPSAEANSTKKTQILIFSFNHKIFGPETTQQQFFECSMKKMVKDVLQGENRLLYTYGVTNSGKTYTIQGKTSFLYYWLQWYKRHSAVQFLF